MKKTFGLLGIVMFSLLLLSGCGNKEVNLSFEEALAVSDKNSETITALFFGTEAPVQQILSLTTTIDDGEGMKIDISLNSQSTSDRAANVSKAAFDFDADINQDDMAISASGTIEALVNAENIFLNVKELGIGSSERDEDPTMGMVAMMIQGIQGQWFKIPLEGTEDLVRGFNTYFSNLPELQAKNSGLYVEVGSDPYQGDFSQFNGKQAYQFTIDQEKYQSLMSEVLVMINDLNRQSLAANTALIMATEEEDILAEIMIDDIQIPVFEGNLVILDKNTVITVIDSIEIIVEDVHLVGSFRGGSEGLVGTFIEKETGTEILSMAIEKTKKDTFSVDITMAEVISIKGTASANIKKSELKLGFDITLEVNDIPDLPTGTLKIPLKGELSYKTIGSVVIEEPTDAVDLMEMFGGMLGMGDL